MYRLYYSSLGDTDASYLTFQTEPEAKTECDKLNNPNLTIQGLGKWIYKKECTKCKHPGCPKCGMTHFMSECNY